MDLFILCLMIYQQRIPVFCCLFFLTKTKIANVRRRAKKISEGT